MENKPPDIFEKLLAELKDLKAKSSPPDLNADQRHKLQTIIRDLYQVKENLDRDLLKNYFVYLPLFASLTLSLILIFLTNTLEGLKLGM